MDRRGKYTRSLWKGQDNKKRARAWRYPKSQWNALLHRKQPAVTIAAAATNVQIDHFAFAGGAVVSTITGCLT